MSFPATEHYSQDFMSNSMFKNDRSLFRPWNHEPTNRLLSEQNDFVPSHRPLMVMEENSKYSDCDDSSGSYVQNYGKLDL